MFVSMRHIKFKYKNSKEDVIKDFSIDINKGDIVSILGESGSGKSTILRIISGLEVPISGELKIDNRTLVDTNTFLSPENRGIGMLFQDYALFPHMTVAQNIKFGLKKLSKRQKTERLNEVLELVNLVEYKDRYPYELSGGQQQRIALARAIAPKPSVMLLDEPFSNLDANLKNKIRDELKRILKETGITSIFVTHDKEDALSIANKVVILDKGKMINYGNSKEVINTHFSN